MKIKKPVTKGIAKTPVVMQLEALECGAASLTMILNYYDKWIPLEQVRVDCGVSRDGSNAKNIMKAGASYGLECNAYRFEPEDLIENGYFPCIIHWNFNHFVVLKGIKGKNAYINDPARGEVKVSLDEFNESFTGVCLCFEPSKEFVPSGKKKTVFDRAKNRLSGLRNAIIIAFLLVCITNLMNIIQPAFTRVFYDQILSGENVNWFTPFIIGLMIISCIQIIVSAFGCFYNNRLNCEIESVGSTQFVWKALRLPIEFFSQRMTGDILSRENSNSSIANTLVNIFTPLIMNVVMMIFYFVVMLRYNVLLTIISIASLAVQIASSTITSKKRVNINRASLRDAGKLSSTTTAGIEMIETIKASGSENGFFEKWSGYQANVNEGNVKINKASYYINLIPSIISTIASAAIMTIGIYLTIKGQFTLGMLTAFQGYVGSFSSPVSSLINASQTIRSMETEMERIDDVMDYPIDPLFDNENGSLNNYEKLSGNIEIKNVTFGYSRLANPLIKDFNMTIKPGSRVAIVGVSGCGKSTLAKLISGLVQPWSGEILFDGKKINEIDRSLFTGSVAVVDQDVTIFEDSIKNNIKMWDESIEDFEVILAARDAEIHEDIIARENGYDYALSEDGKDFSGGQKQRLEIARVLAQDPTICILDEATSALDAKTEYNVINSIKNRGITCIVVAHRLSTIKDCDEIIVLDKGAVVERGKHEDLMKLNGYYTKLVTSE